MGILVPAPAWHNTCQFAQRRLMDESLEIDTGPEKICLTIKNIHVIILNVCVVFREVSYEIANDIRKGGKNG